MDNHHRMDSSMSSLYSGSGISHSRSNLGNEMSSSVSLSPVGVSGVGGGGTSSSTGLRATTIGTIVVRNGPIQLVIALLQSPERTFIKVVEIEPKLTTLGESIDEAIYLQRQHDETLKKMQGLPTPLEEFGRKADKLLASKRINSELVNAMADTMHIVWEDIIRLLHNRKHLLDLCTNFHDKMGSCRNKMASLEAVCKDTMISIEVNAVQEFLNKLKQLRIDVLTSIMAALKDGNELLAQLQDLAKLESLDTRPEHIKRDAMRAVSQVQQWLESLHDRRNALEIAWQTRKTQLEQCLALAILAKECEEVENSLRERRQDLAGIFSLGECEQTSNTSLQLYHELKHYALQLRDRALKITRAKEKLVSTGTFAGDEACARAYTVLSGCTDYLDLVDQREHLLSQSKEFFTKAEKTLTVLEKLEIELSTVKVPVNTPESFTMYSKVLKDVRAFTEEPHRLGYGILDEVGRTKPETQGIKRVLDEIENRKIYIEGICSTSTEEQVRVQEALNEFLEQYNQLLSWLMSPGRTFLQKNVSMGRNQQESKIFLLQHHELMQDLEIRGEHINQLLESIKTHLEALSPQQRYDVDSKAESLHKHWIELKDLILKRVDGVSMLIEFFVCAEKLTDQLDNLDRQLQHTPNEQKIRFLQDAWSNVKSDYGELKNYGTRFINMKMVDPYLEMKSSTSAVEDILNGFSSRQVDVTTSLENWTTHIAEKREIEIILERIMNDNYETETKTTRVDTQLYPVFTSTSEDAKFLLNETTDKRANVLKDIEKAQDEIQQRIHTTVNLHTKDPESQQKIEQVISNLRTLKGKLDGIRYDYKNLLDNMLSFLENVIKVRHQIDDYFIAQKTLFPNSNADRIDRIIADHEKFREMCMDKFRSLITQSELLIDRVRALEPPGAREIDTDRILRLLENLRIHFDSSNSERMSDLDRLEKLENFKSDLCDINRSLDGVSKQLTDINGQNIDSLAAAKTTSLAFEYFERTVELLEKRITKFIETSTHQLFISNPDSSEYVRDELRKLEEKWRNFKEQVKSKRCSLNSAADFFEIVEKIDAEYREITYFYSSISNKITYLRDPVEASNLVNDIEKYVGSREGPLREKLENASKCSHDMTKVSMLYNDVMTMFQSFVKLKSDINVVQERLKNEERLREQCEREAKEKLAREQAAREQAAREQVESERVAREQAERERVAREQAERVRVAREQAERERIAREQADRERVAREQSDRERAAREQAAREQAAREQAAREQTAREKEEREQAARERAVREQAEREQIAREQAARERAAREQAEREQNAREQAAREHAAREQAARDEEARIQAARQKAEREHAAREQAAREDATLLQAARDQIDHSRLITENMRKEVHIHEIFSEIKYASPRFTRQLKDAVTREGDKFTFECEVTGNPEPSVEWFKDGISIQNNPDYKTTHSNGVSRLVIEETFTADSARFSCRASNLVGVSDTTANLLVRENSVELQMIPPRIVRFLESGKATEGASFQFQCTVTGNPLPTVQWYKNDKCIDDSPDYVISYNNGEATLRFEEVFLEDDAVYTCSASNPVGIEHCSASLIVEPLEPTEVPHFKIPLTNVMARVGQKLKLEALIGGIPRPDIFWLHNGKPFVGRDLKYEYGRVTLIIPEAYPNDSGTYVLTAKNLAGEAYSSCNVTVKGRLPNETSDSEIASDMEPIKPSVQLPLKDVSIFEGKSVRLDCVIVGQPEPEVIWYHNERPVKESADVQLLFQGDRCSLVVQEVFQEDAGNYKVVAINSAGEASSSCEVKVTPLNIAEPATRLNSERVSVPKESLPKFEKFLSDVLVAEGEPVEMEVIATGDQPLKAKWFLSNKELFETDRISFFSDTSSGVFKLIFKNVSVDDKGVYTVKVSNDAGDAKCFSHLIVKSVNAPESRERPQQMEIDEKLACPTFKELFYDKSVHPDEVVKFECIVKGKPTPKARWFFNDQAVHGKNFLISTSGERQVLTIPQASPETVGKICCVAENDVGKATCVAFLNLIGSGVIQPATINDVQSITQEHNTESSHVTIKKQTFTSTATSQVNSFEGTIPQTEVHTSTAHIDQSFKQLGSHRPEILESHHYEEVHKSNGIPLPSVQQKSIAFVQSASPLPSVTPASPRSTRKQIAPRFTTPLTGKIVDQGADVSMEAIYDGFPSPEIKIQRNGDELFQTDRAKITNKCNRVTIDLKHVGVSDAGRYSVTAKNSVGQSTSTADLVVKKTIFPPVFGRRLQAQVVKKGERIVMEVEVTGLPEPTVTWMKDDKLLKDAGLSEYRVKSVGNSHTLIIEKGQTTDSGKFMVRATNAGGEAKSIADCAILEPTPERMVELVKTIVYETPSDFKTEILKAEPPSFQTSKTEATSSSDMHGLSESKIITEHRCTTEATMRLEHKSAYLDLPTTPLTTQELPKSTPDTNMEHREQFQKKTVSTYIDTGYSKSGLTQIPPQVPPKPCPPATTAPATILPVNGTMTPTIESSSIDKKSSYEFFEKNIQSEQQSEKYTKFQDVTTPPSLVTLAKKLPVNVPTVTETDFKVLNLIPGSPPEICYTPEVPEKLTRRISEKVKKFDTTQDTGKEAVPSMQLDVTDSTFSTDQVKIASGQPIMRPSVASLPAPTRRFTRSPSPKPSAEGIAMEKLWTQTHGHGYESCHSDFEQNYKTVSDSEHHPTMSLSETKQMFEEKIRETQQIPSSGTALRAPSLVKQVASKPLPMTTSEHLSKDINLIPGSPPEICFAPKLEERRQSLVGAMEKSLELDLLRGPSKVLPHSVPTIGPQIPVGKRPTPIVLCTPPPQERKFKPPPPVVPPKFARSEVYESDYESDLWKYSGSESDEPSFRPVKPPVVVGIRPKSIEGFSSVGAPPTSVPTAPTFKVSGYAADTEEMSSYRKMESIHESRQYFESSSPSSKQPQPLQKIYPAPNQIQNGDLHGHKNELNREEKNFKKTTSMVSNISFSTGGGPTTTTIPKFQASAKVQIPAAPSPSMMQFTRAPDFSDYSSEVEERFRSVSRTYDSESEIKGYRVVHPPTPTTVGSKSSISNGHKSPVFVPSPMQFEHQTVTVSSPYRPKFEPIKQEAHHQFKMQQQEKQQPTKQPPHVFKPKPVAAKFIEATQQQQQQQQHSKPTMYYTAVTGTPTHLAKMATETKNVMHMKESSESCQRVVNMQQTKRIIHFDSQSDKQETTSTMMPANLEPFPYSPSPSRLTPARQQHHTPTMTTTPTKFTPGEFRESDYESEVDGARIRPLWTPNPLEIGELRYRHVEPPHPGRSVSLPRTYEGVISPMQFDRGPEMPSKIHIDPNELRQHHSHSSGKTQTLDRHSSMRNTYNQDQYQQQHSTLQTTRDDMNLKVGSPPKYCYIEARAANQGKNMGSSFLRKSHQFVDDVTSDFSRTASEQKQPQPPIHAFRPGFKRAPSEGETSKPQAYRDESRVSQYGTKCVDPNTGLIYFKYDFGYEFGILFPGEGKKFVGGKWNSQASLPSAKSGASGKQISYPLGGGDLVIPVQHEHTMPTHKRSAPPSHYGGSNPDLNVSLSKLHQHSADTGSAASGSVNILKKRYSLPNPYSIDLNIDRLHHKDAVYVNGSRTVEELPSDVPVNAHINRDEYPKKPPVFITPLKDIAVMTGQTARFECILQSHPNANIVWSKNGFELQHSNKHFIEFRNGVCRLTIPEAYPDDAGVYSCCGNNPLGTGTTSAQLLVPGNNRNLRY